MKDVIITNNDKGGVVTNTDTENFIEEAEGQLNGERQISHITTRSNIR